MKHAAIIAAVLLGACSAPADPEKPQQLGALAQPGARHIEYWPVDTTTQRDDTLLAGGYRLRWVSYSLNDSAVVDRVGGPPLQGAHNEQTTLWGEQNGRPLFEVKLGKELFCQPVATDRVWRLIGYQRSEGREAVFLATLCYPDSDVCETAEIGVSPQGKARLLRRLPPEPME